MSNPKSNLSPREVSEAQNAISFLSKLVSSTEDRPMQRPLNSEGQGSSQDNDPSEESALLARADEVIDRLRRVRRGCQAEELRKSGKGKKRIADEIGTLFPHQKKGKPVKKTSSWTHRFVCLAMCDQDSIPTTSSEKDRLICAGLGEKKIVFDDVDCNAEKFKDSLLTTFPKLIDGGGYQLCKCRPNTRKLEPLSSSSLRSPRALQSCGGNSRTYIRPLQKDLDLSRCDDAADAAEEMTEMCLSCGLSLPIDELQEHVKFCKEIFGEESEDYDDSQTQRTTKWQSDTEHSTCERSDGDGQTQSSTQWLSDTEHSTYEKSDDGDGQIQSTATQWQVDPGHNMQNDFSYADTHRTAEITASDDVISLTYSPSPPSYEHLPSTSPPLPVGLRDIIEEIQTVNDIQLTVPDDHQKMLLEFRRKHVVQDALRHAMKKKFSPEKSLKVIFVGEEGEDTGGIRREFWRLFAMGVTNQYFIGDIHYTMRPDVSALQANEYKHIGRWTAMSIAQEGFGLPVFAPSVYEYFVSGDITRVTFKEDEIPHPGVRYAISQIRAAHDDKSLSEVFQDDDLSNLLFETGYLKSVTVNQKEEIISVIASYHTVVKVKAQLDQFLEGLKSLSVDKYIKAHPDVMRSLFVHTGKKLTSGFIKSLLCVKFCNKDDPKRSLEEQAYMFFVDFLDDCEDAESSHQATLEDVLIFFTGADREPPLGFSTHPSLTFIHDPDSHLATASTCLLELRLPTCHCSYNTFRDSLLLSFCGHSGFGLV